MPRRARSIQGGLVYHILNRAQTQAELDALRRSVRQGQPYGTEAMAQKPGANEPSSDWTSSGRFAHADDPVKQRHPRKKAPVPFFPPFFPFFPPDEGDY